MWLKYDERILPVYSPAIMRDINNLAEMELQSGYIYKGKDGSVRTVSSYEYPNGCINIHTEYQGGVRKIGNEINYRIEDTRQYNTLHAINNNGVCRIVYWVEGSNKSDKTALKKKKMITSNTNCEFRETNVEEWIKWCGWSEGALEPCSIVPDTTPLSVDEIAAANIENIKKLSKAGVTAQIVPVLEQARQVEKMNYKDFDISRAEKVSKK